MLSETLEKFGYPDTMIREYHHWVVLLRQKQVTLGSLIILCREEAQAFSLISSGAQAELPLVVREVEHHLSSLFHYDKINYLMLMMVDPEVHWHVIPRYGKTQQFAGMEFVDHNWPKPPDLNQVNDVPEDVTEELLRQLREKFTR